MARASASSTTRCSTRCRHPPGSTRTKKTRPSRSFSARRRTAASSTRQSRCASRCLGRPNAGKSTLLNHILGEDRLLTGPEPGITRDSIGLETEWRGRKLKLFDTAGLRRQSRVVEKVEKLAVADALRAVRFAEVVVVLLDATIPFEKQDLTLADLVEREGRALVIGLNKWDLIDNKSDRARELRAEADRLLPQLRGTRVIPVSGLTGAHIDKLIEAVIATHEIWNTRISTGRLNRWLAPVINSTPPPAVSGRRIKIRYMTQPKARPPFFVLFGNSVETIPESYKRYLVNGLRETFGLFGVPIRLSMRSGGEILTHRRGGEDDPVIPDHRGAIDRESINDIRRRFTTLDSRSDLRPAGNDSVEESTSGPASLPVLPRHRIGRQLQLIPCLNHRCPSSRPEPRAALPRRRLSARRAIS